MQNLQYNGEPIRLTLHALSYTERRGFNAGEVERAIIEGKWEHSEKERLQSMLNFTYEKDWNGKYYAVKQIRPIFVVEDEEIVVITVYTYYF